MNKILVVDDNPAVCDALRIMLELHDYQVAIANSPQEALQIVDFQRIALVIQDMNFSADTTSGEEGKALFYQLRKLKPDLPIILLTAWTQLETAVALVRAGAADYLSKPWDDNKLLTTIQNLLELSELQQQNKQLIRQQQQRDLALSANNLCGLVYASVPMQRLIDLTLQVAKSDISVLITGANGSGKEKIAEIIQANSPLVDAPFIKVNVGALPLELMEAELFGAEPGAYTGLTKQRIGRFEAADGGTLFLDEIGNLPLSGQMKLLRVLQTGEFERLGSHKTQQVNVRVISATNADLLADIQSGKFREDLYYRLNVIELEILPLAARQDDILALARHFLPPEIELPVLTEQALLAHHWPGNVRELENSCKRAALLAMNRICNDQESNCVLEAADFGLMAADNEWLSASHAKINNEPTKQQIELALTRHNGIITRVAKTFNLSRQALYRRMDKFGIER